MQRFYLNQSTPTIYNTGIKKILLANCFYVYLLQIPDENLRSALPLTPNIAQQIHKEVFLQRAEMNLKLD